MRRGNFFGGASDCSYTPAVELIVSDTATAKGISNAPDLFSPQASNLSTLSSMLGALCNEIGPFTVASAFRSQALQDELLAEGLPAAAHSLHTDGKAADIIPTTMSARDFFKAILNSHWYNDMGEIFIKESQGSLHITLPAPEYGKIGFAGYLTAGETYIHMPDSQVQTFLATGELPYDVAAPTGDTPATPEAEGTVDTFGSTDPTVAIAFVALLASAGFLLYAFGDSSKKTSTV